MGTDIAVIERQLRPLIPSFAEALQGTGLPPEKLVRTVLICLEKTPKLLECTTISILQSAMSAAVLGLEADGTLGQFFMLPFKGKAQAVIGYRGYNTLAARSGFVINGGVVHDGDDFDFELGSNGFVRHKPSLGAGRGRRLIAAWATASHPGRTDIISVLDLDDLLFVKGRSPGARMSDSPWNDPEIGFKAMSEKTAKRRLARSLPINLMVTASIMEEAHEEGGKHAYIDPQKGIVIDGDAVPFPEQSAGPSVSTIEPPRFIVQGRDTQRVFPTIEQWRAEIMKVIGELPMSRLEQFRELNQPVLDKYRADHPEHVAAVEAALAKPERATVSDPSTKPSEAPVMDTAVEEAGSDSETNARPSGGGGSPAPTFWDREDLTIAVPYRGTRPDWPAWAGEFFKIASTAPHSTALAMLMGANEKSIREYKRVAGDLESSRFDNAKDVIFKRLPP
jgi:recombination protein RecT